MSGFHVPRQKRIFRPEHRASSDPATSYQVPSGPSDQAQAVGIPGRHHRLGREGPGPGLLAARDAQTTAGLEEPVRRSH